MKIDKSKQIIVQGNSGCWMSKRRYSKNRRNPEKGKKITSKPALLEEANVEELVGTNQLFANVSNLLEPSTI